VTFPAHISPVPLQTSAYNTPSLVYVVQLLFWLVQWKEKQFLLLCPIGHYTFKLHSRKTTYEFTAKRADDANEWVAVLQDVRECVTV